MSNGIRHPLDHSWLNRVVAGKIKLAADAAHYFKEGLKG
jgi:hypothetical protein